VVHDRVRVGAAVSQVSGLRVRQEVRGTGFAGKFGGVVPFFFGVMRDIILG